MAEYTTVWTGEYPNLCSGSWELYKDGELLDIEIPFQGENAGTYKIYERWAFTDDWAEEWSEYESGLDADAWCDEYEDWLRGFAPEEDWFDIYEAFCQHDWRHNSCGGCI